MFFLFILFQMVVGTNDQPIIYRWPKPLPPSICLFKVSNRNTITRCEICLKLTLCSSVSVVNFSAGKCRLGSYLVVSIFPFVMRCTIWYHLYNLKNVKNVHGGVLIISACNFTKSDTPPWVFFTFFKLYKWY